MVHILHISEEDILIVLHSLQDMVDIFRENQCQFSQLERQSFFEAHNQIQTILLRSYGESEGV